MTTKELNEVKEMILQEMRDYVEMEKGVWKSIKEVRGSDHEDTTRALSWYAACSQFLYHMETELEEQPEEGS